MNYKNKPEIKDSFLLIQMLNVKSLLALNQLFKTHYTKEQVKKQIKVLRKEKSFKFWNNLMRTPPGFGRHYKKI